jgi:hypothetical protein
MSREELARMQAEMVRALRGGEDAGLAHARAVLLAKRRREVEVAAPVLAGALGERFAELFAAYAREAGYPGRGGPAADGALFGRWLQRRAELPGAAVWEAARLRARVGFRVQVVRVGWRAGWAVRPSASAVL